MSLSLDGIYIIADWMVVWRRRQLLGSGGVECHPEIKWDGRIKVKLDANERLEDVKYIN